MSLAAGRLDVVSPLAATSALVTFVLWNFALSRLSPDIADDRGDTSTSRRTNPHEGRGVAPPTMKRVRPGTRIRLQSTVDLSLISPTRRVGINPEFRACEKIVVYKLLSPTGLSRPWILVDLPGAASEGRPR